MKKLLCLVMVLCLGSTAVAEELRVLAWNVESDGNDPATIATEITGLQQQHGPFDVVGLTEVLAENAERYAKAFGDHYDFRVSNTGNSDRMVIVFNADRMSLIETRELTSHEGIRLNHRNRFRSPFVAEFQETNGTRRFQFMVNHLARGDAGARTTQAVGLREWGRDQTLPTIVAGDMNFDANFDSPNDPELDGNAAFVEFFKDNVWTWVRPVPLVDTNHSGGAQDSFPNSILDYICVTQKPDGWTTKQSQVIVRPGDLPDDRKTSDHRPIMAVFSSDDDRVNVAEILSRIRSIQRELESLERMLEGR